MKKTTLAAFLFIAMATAHGQEADRPLSRTVFKLSPQHFIHNSLKAGVEHFNHDHSRSVSFFITGMLENKEHSFYGSGYDGLAGEWQYRSYVSPMKTYRSKRDNAHDRGVYAAAYMQAGFYKGRFQGHSRDYDPVTGALSWYGYNYSEKIVNGGLGFTIGYQRTLWQVIFIEAFIGGGIQFSRSDYAGVTGNAEHFTGYDIGEPSYEGIVPKIGLNVGIGL